MDHDDWEPLRPARRAGMRWTGAFAASLGLVAIIAACSPRGPGSWSVGNGAGAGSGSSSGAGSGSDSGVGGPGGDDGSAGAPAPDMATVSRNLRRLSRREYNNVVRDLLGDTTQPANSFGQEVYTSGFDNGADSLTVQGTDVLAFEAAAESLAAAAVANHPELLIGSCNPQTNEMACVNAFFSTFVPRAYRRPPTATETQRLQTVYTAGAANGGFQAGLELMVEAVLQSPSFLYREELGAPDPSLSPGTVRLTDYEVASELSFLLTGSMPDAELTMAAQNGTLKTTDDFRREAARLLSSDVAKPAMRSFMHQWLATDQVSEVNKDSTVYAQFTPALATSMATELDHFYDQVLWNGTGSIKELLSSTTSSVDSNLATLVYNIAAPSSGFQQVSLDPQLRQGVMTRAGFLAAHSDVDSSGPVPRGVFVLLTMLCVPPISPPPNVPAPPPASQAAAMHQTTRQRFEGHLTASFCSGCHSVIDGVGFGFEQFDGMGVYRTTENGSPVDSSGSLQGTDVDGNFVGVSQLEQKLVGSQEVLSCFVKQAYRYAMGQEESTAAQGALGIMQSGFTADSHVTDTFNALLGSKAFVLRTTAQTM